MALRETEIAALAASWLRSRDLEVFQEVEHKTGRIDLVGRQHRYTVAVECKVGFGLAVIEQAWSHLDEANECWVAVPEPKRSYLSRLGLKLCEDHGIGVLLVAPGPGRVETELDAVPRQHKHQRLHKALHPEQKTAAPAGTNGGGYSTEFSRTAARLVEAVKARPGVTLGDVLLDLDYHYKHRRGAISALSGLMNRKHGRPQVLRGVRIEGAGSKATLWPVGEDVF